ncbi:DUF4232 domain-containing protein [Streptomyces subrutilus]|uniref:DUF4232 domain-containing protein n=1 Tax=Streptomyces subrutilus TaxID=36818 RepID=A0A5P2UP06_9ACTN|nr:DUF4232 domain-containing protein [Streptomyces subrutilus]QEU80843.1 DUF4232 domain-containing protein [Streptomyces subrutilus]WSJ29864.1 DUF4232 domain-containing protein [Streptomyces subrutilus]GGZ97475.1 hypothetical protein GCM10010371_66600 [Streptomyces subrutilus]
MRVHKLTVAALAVAAGLTLTACQNGEDGVAQGGPSSASTASNAPSASAPSAAGGGSSSGSADQGGGKNSSTTGSNGKGTAAGTDTSAKCRTDELEITAIDATISGDANGTVAVELKSRANRDCTLSEYAGVDLKTSAGSISAKRTGEHPGPVVLKKATSVYFGVTYPVNDSGGSGVRVTGLVVTPPDETKSVTLAWPGAATLPVTEGAGSSVKVGPMGSAGQGG